MGKKLVFVAGIILALLVSLAGTGVAVAERPEMVNVLIGFDRQPGPTEEGIVHGAGGSIKYTYNLVPAIAASVPEAAIEGLKKNPRVTRVEPDILVYAIDAELDSTWGVKRIGAGIVHDSGNRGSGVKVAIIDSGIDYTHPDLDANYAGGYDFFNGDPDPMDDNGHGTHVAGTVAAEDNSIGVVGVAPGAKLYALKVLGAGGNGYYSDVIAALQWCVSNGIQVTNNSYGSSGDPGETVKAAFGNAYTAGVLHVAAAGNSGNAPGKGDNVIYPARWASVIAVAATNKNDERATWSSTGPDVELAAPGVDVNSTLLGGGYGEKSGTSMASPHVAGTAALVIVAGIADANSDGRINDEVRQKLDNTADDLGSPGRDPKYGYGLVDADEAAAGPPQPAVNVGLSTDKSQYISGTDTTAVLKSVVTNEIGSAISGLSSVAFTTKVDGVVTSVTFSETATAGTYQGTLNISGLAVGTHTVEVTVTDSRGISGSGSASFSIVSEPTTKSILADKTEFRTAPKGKSGQVTLLLDVHVVEGAVGGPLVAGATVYVEITAPDGTLYAGSGDTNSNGDVTFQVPGNPQSGTWKAKVTNIEEPGYQFDPTKGDTTAEITL